MPKRCVVCGNYYQRGLTTLHRLPKDVEQRSRWLEALPNIEICPQIQNIFVCSDHFNESDTYLTPTGIKYIKNNAVPFSANRDEALVSECSNMEIISEVANQESENLPIISTVMPLSNRPTTEQNQNVELISSPPKSSSSTLSANSFDSSETITASSIEEENKENIFRASRVPLKRTIAMVSETDSDFKKRTLHVPTKRYKERANKNTIARRKNPYYFGDCHLSDMDNPVTARRNWIIATSTISKQRKKINRLVQSNRRSKYRLQKLHSLLTYLKNRDMLSSNATEILSGANETTTELINSFLRGPSKKKYCPALRTFALTLNFYSNEAYKYVRQKLNNTLPHPRTIGKWYQHINGSPGFTKEAFYAIKSKVEESKSKDQEIFCSIVLDEMAIREKIEYANSKYYGYVDLGTEIQTDSVAAAKEVLVIMVVCINGNWKIPIAYFLINGLNGQEKCNLIRMSLQFLHETGIKIISLTFDGAASNISMAKHLGAKLHDSNNLNTSFQHPITKENIYIIFDACHMIKLLRNALGTYKVLFDSDGNQILWQHLEKLVEIQNTEELHAGTKIRTRHINFQREVMKVNLAAQTLSKSVADALRFLSSLKKPGFENIQGTAKYVEMANNIFDIFNCRNFLSKSTYRISMSLKNADRIFKCMNETEQYIKRLRYENMEILKSGRKIGFLGFLVNINSLRGIYFQYVACDNPPLKYILTYKMSQDHLETFFSAIRRKGGFNNNPTARQLQGIYKRLLIYSEVKASDNANVKNNSCVILSCTSDSLINKFGYSTTEIPISDDISCYVDSIFVNLTEYQEEVVGYIAGYIVKCIKKEVVCTFCLNILEDINPYSLLQICKTYGNLVNASEFVVNLCKNAEKFFKYIKCIENLKLKNNIPNYLVIKMLSTLEPTVFSIFGNHIYDEEPLANHGLELIKLILKKYFVLRLHHDNKQETTKEMRVRTHLTKSILFRHQ